MFVSSIRWWLSNKCKVKVSGWWLVKLLAFAVVVSSSGLGLNWHWMARLVDDQINGSWDLQETATSKCLTLLGDAWWSPKIHVCCLLRAVGKKRFDCTVDVMSSRLNSYQLFRTRIVPGIETLSHLNSYRSEFVQWYSPIVFNFTGFTGSQSWNIDNLIDT